MAEIIFDKAKRVSSPLNISLNGGTTEGTNKFTYDGSSSKTLNITPSLIGAATSNHSHGVATTSVNGFLSSGDKSLINSIGTPAQLVTSSKQIVGSINETNTNINNVNKAFNTFLANQFNPLNSTVGTLQGLINTVQSSLTQLDKRVPVQNGIISNGVNFNNLLHGIYMIGQHTSYVNAPRCDWGVLVALNSNNGYSIQFAKSCIDDRYLWVRCKSETNTWTPWRYAKLDPVGKTILNVQTIVVRCGSLAVNASGSGQTAFTPISGATQYIPCLQADGYVQVSGIEIRGTSLYCTFINTSSGAHTGAAIFAILAIGDI